MEREYPKLDEIFKLMKTGHTVLYGPKGVGKSTTLLEAYHKIKSCGEGALWTDLATDTDSRYANSSVDPGFFIFVDNAQLLRKDSFKHLTALLLIANVCLAFSSTSSGEGSYSNCRLQIKHVCYMTPFTPTELVSYISTHSPAQQYTHATTLPIIVERVLVNPSSNYDTILMKEITHVLDKVKEALIKGERDANSIFASLYTVCLHGTCGNLSSSVLQDRGLVYKKGDEVCLVYEKKYLIFSLCSYAKTLHELFMQYDIGGAKELLFAHLSSTSGISVVCTGSKCLTIKGKRAEMPRAINLPCSDYLVQKHIGDNVAADENKCYLIKLAHDHIAIDFLILDCSRGTAASKTLYYIQVSSSRYQDRPENKKFGAIFRNTSTLSGMCAYEYYFNKFKIKNYNAFYIYSSPNIPPAMSNADEMKHIYFHHLQLSNP